MAREDIERRGLYAPGWAGTVEDVAKVAEVVLTEMEAGGVPSPNFDISTYVWDGPRQQELVASSVGEFLEKAREIDPAKISRITIWAWKSRGTGSASEDQSIHVAFDRTAYYAVHIDVQAPAAHTSFVVAADDAMARAIGVKERWRPNFDRWISALAVLIAFAASIVSALADREQALWRVSLVGLAVAGVSLWVLRRLVKWLFPPFELLPEGQLARERRVLQRAAQGLRASWPVWGAFLGTLAAFAVVRIF